LERHQRRLLPRPGGGRSGNKDAVKFRPVLETERFSALLDGEIDVLSRNVAMTSSHDTALGIRFPGSSSSTARVHGAQVARRRQRARAVGGTHLRHGGDAPMRRIGDYFARSGCHSSSPRFDKWQDAVAAYTNKSCQVLSADVSGWGSRVSSSADRAST
jgi:general L-amino acid transport system substrate-binding protein